jgi:LysM repeat protein
MNCHGAFTYEIFPDGKVSIVESKEEEIKRSLYMSIKKIVLGTTLAAGAAIFAGATEAHADTAYTVKSGDTLSTISQKFAGDNSLVEKIAKANSIENINWIYVGEELSIPTDKEATVQKEEVQQSTYVAPAQTQAATTTPAAQAAPAQTATPAAAPATSSDSNSAKEWIAQKESSGSYTATNGRYIGRYQLDASYLNGDYSAANQERVAEQYVSSRYGSWEAAKTFWVANGWY